MGRAGGGGRVGGGRSGGGSFSRSSGGRSFSSGGRSSFGGSSFGGSRPGGSFGGPVHHRPPHYRPHHHVNLGPLVWGSGLGRRTVIINNNGNTTNTSGTQTTQNNMQGAERATTYTAPKPLTPEQKINRTERLAEEAGKSKKNSLKIFLVAALLVAMGLFISIASKGNQYEKPVLTGTVYAGYAYDDGFTYNGGKTEEACEYFYQQTGIPLYFYTVGTYDGDASTCDAYTMDLYDTLFKDENHVLVAYYDNVDWWSWAIGENAKLYMGEDEVNDLIDKIYLSWDNYSLSNDAVLAKGIVSYSDSLSKANSGAGVFSGFFYVAGVFVALVAVISYVNHSKQEKQYTEQAQTLRTEQMLSKPLETFGNQEVDDLKEKYDNM